MDVALTHIISELYANVFIECVVYVCHLIVIVVIVIMKNERRTLDKISKE